LKLFLFLIFLYTGTGTGTYRYFYRYICPKTQSSVLLEFRNNEAIQHQQHPAVAKPRPAKPEAHAYQPTDLSLRPRLAYPGGQLPVPTHSAALYAPYSHHFSRASPTAGLVSSPSPVGHNRSSHYDSASPSSLHAVNVADLSGHRYRTNSFTSQPSNASPSSSNLSAGSLPSPTIGTARQHQSYPLSDPRTGLANYGSPGHLPPVRPAPTHPNSSSRPAQAAGHSAGGHYDSAAGMPRPSSGSGSRTTAAALPSVTTSSRLNNCNNAQQIVYNNSTAPVSTNSSSGSTGTQQSAAAKVNRPPALLHGAINPISLEQRINKVISQNQAIVETLGKISLGYFPPKVKCTVLFNYSPRVRIFLSRSGLGPLPKIQMLMSVAVPTMIVGLKLNDKFEFC
jgi:hypothetical protein